MTPIALIVCGGRAYRDQDAVFDVLERIHAKYPVHLVIEGGSTGADRLARGWAQARSIPCESFPADWRRLGTRAGPARNAEMLKRLEEHVGLYKVGVVAFPGSTGTADMCRRARERGVKVWEPVRGGR